MHNVDFEYTNPTIVMKVHIHARHIVVPLENSSATLLAES